MAIGLGDCQRMSNLVSKVYNIDDVTAIDETKFNLSTTSDTYDISMKMKSGSTEIQSSPKKDVKSPTQNGKMSLSYSPNGSQYAYERAKMKALFSKKNLSYTENCDLSPSTRARKRKNADYDVESQSKRRKITRSDTKSLFNEGANLCQVVDAREIISAKRAGRVGNENQGVNENETTESADTVGENLKSNNSDFENGYKEVEKAVQSSLMDKSSIKILDQNLNHISDCIRRDSTSDMYSRNLKTICDSSPLKSKMSAFEISLLKGKQNLERRKSIESAALRSSPRMNSNEQRPNYCDKKKIKSRQSLEAGFNKTLRKRSVKSSDLGHRRSRTVDSQDAVSPSLMENEIVRPVPKRRVARVKDEREEKGDNLSGNDEKESSIQYRLNGSPKLKSLPTRISADVLSGTKEKIQGSAFTSLNKTINTRQISGVPPPMYSTTAITDTSSFNKLSQRPSSLTISRNDSSRCNDSKLERCYAKATETARNRRSDLRMEHSHDRDDLDSGKDGTIKKGNRKSLEETVNMLRKNKVTPRVKDDEQMMSLSPSQVSRRSSRSSTVNNSPFKSEILTPSSSPCSSSSRSLCSSPTSSGSSRLKKSRNYLFGRSDEVLARWHDGLYYLGKILKINDKQEKCLLRYEDDSEYWSMFKDIHRVLKEEEMICCVCHSDVSEPPNEIVLCEYCLQGYHQQCHSPFIGSGKILDPDEPWYCRKCIFFLKASGHSIGDEEFQWEEELLKMKVTLPYQLDMLTWDTQHKNNTQQCFCYCGGPGIWFQKMLQCCRCKQWFHEACLQCMKFPLMYADSFYIFVCAICNSGKEYIKRLDVDWSDLVHIGLFNLAMNNKKKLFDLNEELMIWLTTNWDQLQVTKYNDLTEEERLSEMQKALDTNETRFVKGSEYRKRSTLYGLRVRVPPPRIHITLPFSGEVTDQQMNKLKIKGRRSKVFMPVECKSPVNHVVHGPLNPSSSVMKRLDVAALNQAEKKFSPSKQSKAAKKKQKLPLLDKLIPANYIHPFKTETEQAADREETRCRSQIWNKFLSLYDGNEDARANVFSNKNSQDEPPILEKVEPVVPISVSNKTPPMPKIEDKKSSKKSATSDGKNLDKRSSDRARRRKSTQKTLVSTETVSDEKEDSFTVKHVKSVEGGNYYCRYDKTGYGKGFLVVGKRTTRTMDTEYMIQWDF
ncbi:PHD finger protein 19 [Mactra antiquata]